MTAMACAFGLVPAGRSFGKELFSVLTQEEILIISCGHFVDKGNRGGP